MTDDLVKRYQLDYHHTQTYAEMVEDCDGDWVKYNDYKAASDRIEELELAVRYEADLAHQAEARIEELEARLAKAREEGYWQVDHVVGQRKKLTPPSQN
jgi:hypothetical protein